jgi:alpha-beta hydrolase superfamily lysophospholipase
MIHEEGTFNGVKDHVLYYQCWLPEESEAEIVGTVQIVHGVAEHSGRYGNVLNTLVPAGYACFAHDLYGHGKSNGMRKYVDKFEDYIEDQRIFKDFITAMHQELLEKPKFLLGHSMGALIAFYYATIYKHDFTGLILSGFGPRQIYNIPKILLAIGPSLGPTLLSKAIFNSGLTADFVSRDPEVVKAYKEDPLDCDISKFTGRLGGYYIRYGKAIPKNTAKVEEPLLVQVGSGDKFNTDFDKLEGLFTGTEDKTIKIYEGLYHEVYNEFPDDRAIVLNDLLEWIQKRTV